MSAGNKLATSRTDLSSFPLDVFTVDPDFNARIDYGDLDELARSIAVNGYNPNKPLIGYRKDDKIVLVDGHRRIRAITEYLHKYTDTPLKAVPCILEKKGTSPEERVLTMLQAGSGKPLTPIEQAACIKRLLNFGWSMKDVCSKVGKSNSQVSQLLDLNAASTELKNLISSQAISVTAAVKLSKAPEATQTRLIEKIKNLLSDPTSTKKKVVKVKDVEKASKGSAFNISAKEIRTTMEHVDKLIAAGKNAKTWRAVRYGLSLALGESKIDPDFHV